MTADLTEPLPLLPSSRAQRNDDGPLMTAQEVARMLAVPASWVYAQTRLHRIPTVRLGRYYRYRRSAIREWVTQLEGEI